MPRSGISIRTVYRDAAGPATPGRLVGRVVVPDDVRAAGLDAAAVAVTLAGMSSDWLGRYRAGECEGVWNEISRRGVRLRDAPRAMGAAKDVAAEMMYRVRDNVVVLERRLRLAGYEFAADADRHWPAQVITPPRPGVAGELDAVEDAIGGPIPISVRSFLEIVGGLDFGGTLPGWSPRYVDALQVVTETEGLGAMLTDMIDQNALAAEPGGGRRAHLELGGDHLHKANISGGPPCGVYVPDPAPDPIWRHDTLHASHTFVAYLRAAIGDAAVPGWRRTPGDTPPPAVDELVGGLLVF
jgi:hypothetical protein